MVKTTAMILDELSDYASPKDKLQRLVHKGKYIPIIKGLYETNASKSAHLLAPVIYGPSYISFEYALSYYSLIPETVYTITSATFEKKKRKTHKTSFGTYTYQDVPSAVYYYGVRNMYEEEYSYMLATPEKALCDQLYKMKKVHNVYDMTQLLFDDLRIDEYDFKHLNKADILYLAEKYKDTNIKQLRKFLKKV